MSTHFVELARIGTYRIVVDANTGWLQVSWYDSRRRQIRRSTLKTRNVAEACAKVQALVDDHVTGDPRDALRTGRLQTVREVLEAHRPHVDLLVSAEAESIHVDLILASDLADRRLASLTHKDFDGLRDEWLASGVALTTVGRRLSTLRSAIACAVDAKQIRSGEAPKVPEYRTKNVLRAAPPKGLPCTPEQLGQLYDATLQPHLQVYWIVLFATAARSAAALDLTGSQIDRLYGLVHLNPPDRVQTKKYRPVLPMCSPLLSWCAHCPPGYLIQWRGERLTSAKTGVREAVARAGLPPEINSYSVRHAAGRFLRRSGVSTEEIAIWLGHLAPPQNPETTLIYSPYEPGYLGAAKAAMEHFIAAIASKAATPLLTPPAEVIAYFQRLRGKN